LVGHNIRGVSLWNIPLAYNLQPRSTFWPGPIFTIITGLEIISKVLQIFGPLHIHNPLLIPSILSSCVIHPDASTKNANSCGSEPGAPNPFPLGGKMRIGVDPSHGEGRRNAFGRVESRRG
jgi:hypothetical protein